MTTSFAEIEERGIAIGEAKGSAKGKAEGKAEGITEGIALRGMEIARNMFAQQEYKGKPDEVAQLLSDLGILKETIDVSYAEFESGRV